MFVTRIQFHFPFSFNTDKMVFRQIVIGLALLVAVALSGEADVLDLGDDDFNTRVAETETTLVMFYAPW